MLKFIFNLQYIHKIKIIKKLVFKNIFICQKHFLNAVCESLIFIYHNKKSINFFDFLHYSDQLGYNFRISSFRIIQSRRVNNEKLIRGVFPIHFFKYNLFSARICTIRYFKPLSLLNLAKCIASCRFSNSCGPKHKNIWQIDIIIIVFIKFLKLIFIILNVLFLWLYDLVFVRFHLISKNLI